MPTPVGLGVGLVKGAVVTDNVVIADPRPVQLADVIVSDALGPGGGGDSAVVDNQMPDVGQAPGFVGLGGMGGQLTDEVLDDRLGDLCGRLGGRRLARFGNLSLQPFDLLLQELDPLPQRGNQRRWVLGFEGGLDLGQEHVFPALALQPLLARRLGIHELAQADNLLG
jgi:hypothetical protein